MCDAFLQRILKYTQSVKGRTKLPQVIIATPKKAGREIQMGWRSYPSGQGAWLEIRCVLTRRFEPYWARFRPFHEKKEFDSFGHNFQKGLNRESNPEPPAP